MANDVYQLVIIGRSASQFWESVQHWQSAVDTAPNPVGAATNLINGFVAACQNQLRACLTIDSFITGYKCKRVNNGGSPTVMNPITPVAGLAAGTPATSAIGGCITSAYQHNMKFKTGRWFIPGVPESELTGNTFSETYIDNLKDLAAAAQSISEATSTFTFCVWSRTYKLAFIPQYNGVSPKPGVQRRRLLPVM